MTTPPEETTETLEVAEYEELPLTERARYSYQIKTTQNHKGTSHWIGVEIEDGPGLVQDTDPETGEDVLRPEDGDELIYRVEEIAQRRLFALRARLRRDLDLEAAEIRNQQNKEQ